MKKQMLSYKGYDAPYWYDADDKLFEGRVRIGDAHISYQGETYKELVEDYRNAIKDYCAYLKEQGKKKKASGTVIGRITPELHERALCAAASVGESLNSLIRDGIELAIKKYEKKAA